MQSWEIQIALQTPTQFLILWATARYARRPIMIRSRVVASRLFDNAFACAQGLRPAMEDTEIYLHDQDAKCLIVGVADGHGGATVTDWLGRNFARWLCSALKKSGATSEVGVATTIRGVVRSCDAYLFAEWQRNGMEKRSTGSTLTGAVWLYGSCPDLVHIFNVGDSRTFVFSPSGRLTSASSVHLPSDATERMRIGQAGWSVRDVGGVPRVGGTLALSRALGDFEFKTRVRFTEGSSFTYEYVGSRAAVSPEADVYAVQMRPGRRVVLFSCSDGLFDNDALDLADVRRGLFASAYDPEKAAVAVARAALQNKSTDNVSCHLTVLKRETRDQGRAAQASEPICAWP